MITRVKFSLLITLCFLLTGLWSVSAQQSRAPVIAINYSPSQPTETELLPSEQQVVADLRMIKRKVSTIRIGNVAAMGAYITELAERNDLDVVLETMIGADEAANRAEVEAAIQIANDHLNVVGIIVGNEVLSGEVLNADELMDYIVEVRQGVPGRVSVGYADVLLEWLQNTSLAHAVDWVGLNSIPFGECQSLDQAVNFTINQWAILVGNPSYQNERIVISETGWPTQGENFDCTTPVEATPEAQAEFIQTMLEQGRAAQVDLFIASFTDEPWRCATEVNARYNCHLGLVNRDRTPKIAWEQMPRLTPTDDRAIRGIIWTDTGNAANCRSTASLESEVLTGLTTGQPVEVLDRYSEEEWVLVETRDDIRCWTHHSLIRVDGRTLTTASEATQVSTDSLMDYVESVDPAMCPGEDFGSIVSNTWSAPDVVIFAACVGKLQTWLGDADTQQINLIASETCDVEPPSDTQAEIDERFRSSWALDAIAVAYYNFARSLRGAGLFKLSEQAYQAVTRDFSCAWAYGEDGGVPYFWSLAERAQGELETLPILPAEEGEVAASAAPN